MKCRAVNSLVLVLVLVALLTLPLGKTAAAADAGQPLTYELLVPLEQNQICQVSSEHELMVAERFGNDLKAAQSLLTFTGEELLTATEIRLCSDGVLTRTKNVNEDKSVTELYCFYDWSLTAVIPETETRIVTTDSHYLLLMEVTGTSAMANLCYGERRVFDLATGEFVLECGYGSDADEITLPDGGTVTPDRFGFSAFAEAVGTDPGNLQLRPTFSEHPSVYSSAGQLLLDSEETLYYMCFRNDSVCEVIPTDSGNVYRLLDPKGEKITVSGPLEGLTLDMVKANTPDSCYYSDDNDLIIVRSAETELSGVIRLIKAVPGSIFYTDVPEDAWYRGPVEWAISEQITTGTVATALHTGDTAVTFTPDRTCTVKEILTFLWRAAGEPEPSMDNPFSNVSESAYYCKAAVWACEQGMVGGTWFEGDEPCTRAMAVTFLWRCAGSPEAVGETFTDVPADADYASAVAWALSQGVTNGTGNGCFSPETICNRAQIVTFLCRAFGA